MPQHSPKKPQPIPPATRSLTHRFMGGLLSMALSLLLLTGTCLEAVCFPAPAQAQLSSYGFAPQLYKDGVNYGNGIYFAPYVFSIFSQPDEHSPLIGEFHWSQKTHSNSISVNTAHAERRSLSADQVFFSFYPQLDVAMMAVIGENGEGWVEVIYDQAHKKSGWVRLKDQPEPNLASLKPKAQAATSDPSQNALTPLNDSSPGDPPHFGVYQTWAEFMKLNTKANGIYWLNGVKEYNRTIRSSDTDDAKLIPVTIIRHMKVKHLRGNWLLVEVLDFENNTPIGWIRWRDDDGNLMAFPNINQQYHPVIMGSY